MKEFKLFEDFGPRLFIFLAGFPDVFSRGNNIISNYWWIPLIGPLIGAVIASIVYDLIFADKLSLFGHSINLSRKPSVVNNNTEMT